MSRGDGDAENVELSAICPKRQVYNCVRQAGAVLGKNIWVAWPLIIWEATTAKRNYYKTNYIKHVEKFEDLNNPEKKFRGPGQDFGACAPWPQRRTATADRTVRAANSPTRQLARRDVARSNKVGWTVCGGMGRGVPSQVGG